MTGLVRKLAASAAVALFAAAVSAPTAGLAQQQMPAGQKMEKSGQMMDKSSKRAMANKQNMAVQEALNAKGYKVKVDGKMGKETRKALSDFQKSNGLKADGKASKATLEKLGVRA
jgi:peptidoglycan hydrolase-like protein with peptidoglycan-binding domain